MLFEISDLVYRYGDGTAALEGASLSIPEGSRMAILGANGSGKSTLLRLLNGLIFPTSGSVRFRGREISEKALGEADFRQEFRRSVGFVFQNADAQLFNATVGEEIAFGPRQLGMTEQEVKERSDDVMGFLGIGYLADRPPFRISGGEKRKVAIASVLSMNPDVLMFDEPFLGLDPRSQAWLVRTLGQLQDAGKTTIVATHTLEAVPRIASTMMVLSENHKIVHSGPVTEGLENLQLLREANLIEGETVKR
jgi:cobalt/nickel transport system ATP-binding protein